MSLIFLSVAFVLFCVGIGAIVSILVFVIDVIKWHNSEKRSVIIPSAQILPDELKNDKEFMTQAIEKNGFCISWSSDDVYTILSCLALSGMVSLSIPPK